MPAGIFIDHCYPIVGDTSFLRNVVPIYCKVIPVILGKPVQCSKPKYAPAVLKDRIHRIATQAFGDGDPVESYLLSVKF
jgi:hypothetical protein